MFGEESFLTTGRFAYRTLTDVSSMTFCYVLRWEGNFRSRSTCSTWLDPTSVTHLINASL